MDIKDYHWVFLFYRGQRPLSSIPKRSSLPYSKREQAQDKEVNDLRNGHYHALVIAIRSR